MGLLCTSASLAIYHFVEILDPVRNTTTFFKQVHRLVPAGTTIAISLPVFLLGLCSGFPVGAIFISHYYQQNLLNKRQAESLLPLASFVSPMFVAGTSAPR